MPTNKETSSRSDGLETQRHIIAYAGPIFARNGYYKTTSKEICLAAGVNQAAVNYHFGSRDGLYKAVLIEAHRYLINLEELRALRDSHVTPREAIDRFLDHFIAALRTGDWHTKVLTREILSPSPVNGDIIDHTALPKFALVTEFFSDYLHLAQDDIRLYGTILTIMAPFIIAFLADDNPALEHLPLSFEKEDFLEVLRQNAATILETLRP